MSQINHNQQQQFKRKRQAYLAQRKAHKKQARRILIKQFGQSSHSSDSSQPKRPPVIIKAHQQTQFNTYSSKSSGQKQQKQKNPRALRQRRKNQRLNYKKQAQINKRNHFGDSSSDDQQIIIRPKIKIVQNQNDNQQKIQNKLQSNLQRQQTKLLSGNKPVIKKQKSNNQLSHVKLKVQQDKKQLRQKFQIQIPSKKGINLWIQKQLQFRQNCFEYDDRVIAIYDILKLKLLNVEIHSQKKKMKLTLKDQQIYIAASVNKYTQNQYLDHYYYIFAKVIMMKLNLMGKKSIINTKNNVQEKYLKDVKIAGRIRKSSFFGGWEDKICVINNVGLSMYKEGKEKASLFMANGSIKEIWTRFQFQGQNLILKCLHGSSKIQLSIPYQNFLCRDNWLYQIYNLTLQK